MPATSDAPFHPGIPPFFLNGPGHNGVPPPPLTFRDYHPPSGPISPELHIVELNLHHHIDTCFASLSRLVTNKIDQSTDQIIRVQENQDENMTKLTKGTKEDIRSIHEIISTFEKEMREAQATRQPVEFLENLPSTMDNMSLVMQKLGEKLEDLHVGVSNPADSETGRKLLGMEQKLRELAGKVDRLLDRMPSDHQGNGMSPRRSQSASQPSPNTYGPRHQYQSGNSFASASTRNINASSRGRRINSGAITDGRNARREFFAEMGNSMGTAPDLQQHPAYLHTPHSPAYDANGFPVGLGPHGPSYQMPAFAGRDPNAWYQQAYGN